MFRKHCKKSESEFLYKKTDNSWLSTVLSPSILKKARKNAYLWNTLTVRYFCILQITYSLHISRNYQCHGIRLVQNSSFSVRSILSYRAYRCSTFRRAGREYRIEHYRGPRSSSIWVPRNLSDQTDKHASPHRR